MLRKILCMIAASIVIVSACCAMVNARSELTDFTETNENGVTRIYNNNKAFVKKQVELYKESGCGSVDEYVRMLMKKPRWDGDGMVVDVGHLTLTDEQRGSTLINLFVNAALGLEFVEKNELFKEVMEYISLGCWNHEIQRHAVFAVHDIINNSENDTMKKYAEGLLKYFEKRAVPDAKGLNKLNEEIELNRKANELHLEKEMLGLSENEKSEKKRLWNNRFNKDADLCKFVNGDTETKLEFKIADKTEKFNIHELRDNMHMASPEEMYAALTIVNYIWATEYAYLNTALLSYNIFDHLGIKFIMKDDGPEYYIDAKNDVLDYIVQHGESSIWFFVELGFDWEQVRQLFVAYAELDKRITQ